jgi:holo-[acyl-carrier protein] synthase
VYSARGEKMRRKLGIGAGHVTLTDEAGLIVAVAVLEAAPARTKRKRPPKAARKKAKRSRR